MLTKEGMVHTDQHISSRIGWGGILSIGPKAGDDGCRSTRASIRTILQMLRDFKYEVIVVRSTHHESAICGDEYLLLTMNDDAPIFSPIGGVIVPDDVECVHSFMYPPIMSKSA